MGGKTEVLGEKPVPLPMTNSYVLPLCCGNSTCDYFSCSSFVLNSMLLNIYLFLAQHNILIFCSGKICHTALKFSLPVLLVVPCTEQFCQQTRYVVTVLKN